MCVGLAAIAPSFALAFAAVRRLRARRGRLPPEGSRYANYLSGARRATGMSLFSLGGNAGFALGPVLVTPAVALLGLPGALIVAIPGALVALWIARRAAAAAQLPPAPGQAPAPARAAPARTTGAPFSRLGDRDRRAHGRCTSGC